MFFSDWLNLTEDQRESMCQQLIPYDDWDLFKAVESEFIAKFGNQPGIGKVFCGLESGLGPYNIISVEILPNRPRTRLPQKFLGFRISKSYQRK